MGDAAERFDPVSLWEFERMDFGDRKAELVNGRIVVAQAFPTIRHGDIAGGIATALNTLFRARGAPRRASVGSGVTVRRSLDSQLGPDVLVHCGGTRETPGEPVLVVEILSPSNRPRHLEEKLDAYRDLPAIADILLVSQDDHRVTHWTRGAEGWSARILEGAAARLRLERFDAEWTLVAFYGDD